MKRRTLAVLFSSAVLGGTALGLWASVSDNPYQVIVTRNAFALKPPPPPTPPTPVEPPPTAMDVTLTGISTLGGTKKALLVITDKGPGKKPEFPPPLVEGDVQGRVEVVSIDPDKGQVLIKIDGTDKTLEFPTNKEPAKATAPLTPPNPFARPPGMPPLPVATPAAMSTPSPSGRYGVVTGGGNVGTSSLGASAIPSRPLRTDEPSSGVLVGGGGTMGTPTTAPTATPAAPAMTREEAIAHINEQRQLYEEAYKAGLIPKNQNLAPILPPTPGGPAGPPAPAPPTR